MSSLFKRINDIVTANINDLIDRVEDPERMIKQIIREMEDNIRRAKDNVIDAVASEKRLHREVASHRDQAHEWEQKAESALASGNEDLARAALLRKKEHDGVLKSLVPAWEAAKNTSAALQDQLRALEAKLEEAKRKRGTLVARQRAAQARQHMEQTKVTFDNGLATESNFARMEDKVSEIEAQAEAIVEVNSGSAGLEREFQDMELQAEVDAELAALKNKLKDKED